MWYLGVHCCVKDVAQSPRLVITHLTLMASKCEPATGTYTKVDDKQDLSRLKFSVEIGRDRASCD